MIQDQAVGSATVLFAASDAALPMMSRVHGSTPPRRPWRASLNRVIDEAMTLPSTDSGNSVARVWRIGDRIAAAGLFGLGDKGYAGYSPAVLTPFKGRNKPEWKKEANRVHARLRSPGERTMAQLKNWRILRRLRCCPHRATEVARAVLVL